MKVGEVVRLSSGGPKMTVEGPKEGGTVPAVTCVYWVPEQQRFLTESFDCRLLSSAAKE